MEGAWTIEIIAVATTRWLSLRLRLFSALERCGPNTPVRDVTHAQVPQAEPAETVSAALRRFDYTGDQFLCIVENGVLLGVAPLRVWRNVRRKAAVCKNPNNASRVSPLSEAEKTRGPLPDHVTTDRGSDETQRDTTNSLLSGSIPRRRDPEDRAVDVHNIFETRDKMFDKTLADSFPASDPPSTIPDPTEDSFRSSPVSD